MSKLGQQLLVKVKNIHIMKRSHFRYPHAKLNINQVQSSVTAYCSLQTVRHYFWCVKYTGVFTIVVQKRQFVQNNLSCQAFHTLTWSKLVPLWNKTAFAQSTLETIESQDLSTVTINNRTTYFSILLLLLLLVLWIITIIITTNE